MKQKEEKEGEKLLFRVNYDCDNTKKKRKRFTAMHDAREKGKCEKQKRERERKKKNLPSYTRVCSEFERISSKFVVRIFKLLNE
jgi:hypothetical protein